MEKAVINKDLCIVCGICVSISPDTFFFADDGSIGVSNDADASEAIAGCPTGAISQ